MIEVNPEEVAQAEHAKEAEAAAAPAAEAKPKKEKKAKAPKAAKPKADPKPKAEKPKAKPKAKKATKTKAPAKKEKKGPNGCSHRGCSKPARTSRSFWCAEHYKIRRKKQLADNNVTWRDRVKKGKAGHHLTKFGRPTTWAVEHKSQALKLAKERGTVDPEKLEKLIQQKAKALEVKGKKAKKAA